HRLVLLDILGGEESSRLFLHHAKRQHSFAKQFIKDLREARINRREATENSFVTGGMLEAGARGGEIANGEQKEKNCQRSENYLQRAIEPQRADKHDSGK